MTDDTESASAAAGAGGNASKTRHKRTRTGCLKCRIRRRKCDEGKPRCQRCIDGNFDCQYGPRLTFLNKNALTVSPSPRAAEATTPKYSRLQFVSPGTSKQGGSEASPSSPATPKPQETTFAVNNGPAPPPTPTVITFQANNPQPTPEPHPVEYVVPQHHHHHQNPSTAVPWQGVGVHESLASPVRNLDIAGKPPGASPNNDAAYETALNVLLSLGSEGATGAGQSPVQGPGTFAMGGGAGGGGAGVGVGVSPGDMMAVSSNQETGERRDAGVGVGVGADLSQDRLLQLLRYFRYQVAPWLDLCDMGQTFGLYVPRLAIESEGVLHALLAVAATAQQADSRTVAGDVGYLRTLAETGPVKHEGDDTVNDGDLAHLTLSTACRFISDIPNGWHERSVVISDSFWTVALAGASPKTIAILSVLLRLELAAALVTGSPLSVPEKMHHNPLSQQQWTSSSTVAETIFQYTIEPLLLCGKVVNFCAGVPPPPLPPPQQQQQQQHPPDLNTTAAAAPLTPVHRWTLLSDALGAWYASRAQEFRPMVEMDGGGDDDGENLFPVILFTNGAAVLANQLYHTAMLLLLQNRPRTLQAAAKKSSALSPLWHAQRVCGIALNNDRRDSWDLCLVASLYLAAQRMTYEPQQRAVLECLERVKGLTGWNVDGFSARVREDWGFM